MIRNLIFDFDGTLADTSLGIVRCTQTTLETMGLPLSTPERICATIGLPLADCFARGTDTPAERIEEACATYRRLFNDIAVPCIILFPGVAETLAGLDARGFRMSIATSRGSRSLQMLLERMGVAGHFCASAASDTVTRHKPEPDPALYVLEKTGGKPEESLVIGDTTFDILMGQAAGCRTCGVTWGNQDRAQLQAASPDWILDRIEELPGLLG
jgi:phosphoglycolate phosphatase